MQNRSYPTIPRPHIPPALLFGAALLALVPIIGCMAWIYFQWAALAASAPWFTDFVRYSIFLLPLVFGSWGLATVVTIAWRRWGDHKYIQAHHVTQLERARVQVAPNATSFNYHAQNTAPPTQLALPEPAAEKALAVPTFASMLDGDLVGMGRKLVLGYDDGGVLEGDWTDLYSSIVAGMPGQGKTTSQRFFACQTALHGSRFAVIDPHAGAGADSLAATLAPLGRTFLCPIASTDKEILDTVRHIADIGAQRVKGMDRGETPIILWVDELTALLGRSKIGDELAQLLEQIAQEYRKKNVFVSASGQIWTASRATSELRDSFASVICHRMKRGQARMLLPTDEAQLVERLSPGRAVLWRTSGATAMIGIPDTREADVRRVATMLGSSAARVETGSLPATTRVGMGFHPIPKIDPLSTQNRPAANTAPTQALSGQTLSAEALRAHALFLEGKDVTEIVLELRGLKPKDASRYQQALKEIQAFIRAAIAGGVK